LARTARSPLARSSYRQQSENLQEIARFTALGIASVEHDLVAFLRTQGRPAAAAPDRAALQSDIERYLVTQDIVSLRRVQQRWSAHRLQRLVDRDSRQSFLLVFDPQGAPSDGGAVSLTVSSRQVVVNLDSLSGKVSLTD